MRGFVAHNYSILVGAVYITGFALCQSPPGHERSGRGKRNCIVGTTYLEARDLGLARNWESGGKQMRFVVMTFVFVTTIALALDREAMVSAGSEISVLLSTGGPSAGGRTLAVRRLDARVDQEIMAAKYAQIRVGARGFWFLVANLAKPGRLIGETLVRVNETQRTLFAVSDQLRMAVDGRLPLLIFTNGSPSDGVVLALIPGSLPAAQDLDVPGATHILALSGAGDAFQVNRSRAGGRPTLVIEGEIDQGEGRFSERSNGP